MSHTHLRLNGSCLAFFVFLYWNYTLGKVRNHKWYLTFVTWNLSRKLVPHLVLIWFEFVIYCCFCKFPRFFASPSGSGHDLERSKCGKTKQLSMLSDLQKYCFTIRRFTSGAKRSTTESSRRVRKWCHGLTIWNKVPQGSFLLCSLFFSRTLKSKANSD